MYTLYTALERIHRQVESLNALINHRFLHSIQKQQAHWRDRVVSLQDDSIFLLFFVLLLLFVKMRIKKGFLLTLFAPSQATSKQDQISAQRLKKEETSMQDGIFDGFIPKTSALNTPTSEDPVFKEHVSQSGVLNTADVIFQPDILMDQLDGHIQEIKVVLEMFITEHQKDGVLLKEHLQINALEDAVSLMHQLMGVSCSIGAFALTRVSENIHRRLREGKHVNSEMQMQCEALLGVTLERVQDEINRYQSKTGG